MDVDLSIITSPVFRYPGRLGSDTLLSSGFAAPDGMSAGESSVLVLSVFQCVFGKLPPSFILSLHPIIYFLMIINLLFPVYHTSTCLVFLLSPIQNLPTQRFILSSHLSSFLANNVCLLSICLSLCSRYYDINSFNSYVIIPDIITAIL